MQRITTMEGTAIMTICGHTSHSPSNQDQKCNFLTNTVPTKSDTALPKSEHFPSVHTQLQVVGVDEELEDCSWQFESFRHAGPVLALQYELQSESGQ